MPDINTLIAARLHELRDARGLTLDALAAASGVSRSNISLIERGESSPSAVVLDKLATALGVALASLFERPADTAAAQVAPSPLARVADQPLWTDPASGYVRRQVSPAWPSPLQLVDVRFPPGQHVTLETGPRSSDIHQQIWMIEGRMRITVGNTPWDLQAGDCLAMQLDQPMAFHNPTRREARYLVALVTLPLAAATLSRSRP